MKKILIFVTCLLCLTLFIVSCGNSDKDGNSTTKQPETGDIEWSDLTGGTGDTTTDPGDTTTEPGGTTTEPGGPTTEPGGTTATTEPNLDFEVGVDTSEGWSPLNPF